MTVADGTALAVVPRYMFGAEALEAAASAKSDAEELRKDLDEARGQILERQDEN